MDIVQLCSNCIGQAITLIIVTNGKPADASIFLGGPSWHFHVAAFIFIVAAIKEISITLILSQIRTDIRIILDALP